MKYSPLQLCDWLVGYCGSYGASEDNMLIGEKLGYWKEIWIIQQRSFIHLRTELSVKQPEVPVTKKVLKGL